MNEIKRKWKDLLAQRSTRLFVGRDTIIERFRLNCLDIVPRDLVIVLQGTAGIGKSTTIARIRKIANEYDIFTTYVDSSIATPDREKAILRLMVSTAQQFAINDTPLTQFTERYHEYNDALEHISEDDNAPGNPLDAIGGLQDQDPWYDQAWTTYLNATFNTGICKLVRQPIDQLTPIWVQDLNTWAMVKRIILCIDDWQFLEDQLGVWLRTLMRDGEFSTKIWVILATREDLLPDWDSLRPLIALHELKELAEFEMLTYVRSKGISDRQRESDIIAFSDGLPVLVDLLSSVQEGIAGDLALSPLDRYFKWLSNMQRRVVLLASVARYIDAHVLDSIFGKDGEKWFDWLHQANLLSKKGDLWVYHPALRTQFLSWARREMYGATYAAHVALRAYYLSIAGEEETDDDIPGESLSFATIEAIYHGLMIAESGALRHAILTFIHLSRNNYPAAGELLGTFEQATQVQENTNAVVEWTSSLKEIWHAFNAGDWSTAADACEVILGREAVDAEVKSAIALLHNAIEARFPKPVLVSEYQDEAATEVVTTILTEGLSTQDIEVNDKPDEVQTLRADQAEHTVLESVSTAPLPTEKQHTNPPEIISAEAQEVTFQTAEEYLAFADNKLKAGAYSEALNAYSQALALNPSLSKAHFGCARAYTQLGDFPAAIQCYETVLGTERDNIPALRNRGWLYVRQHNYAQALKDYDRAVNLAPQDVSLVCARANIFYRLKDYSNALRGYDEAIRRDSKYVEAYLNRGVTHAVLQEYRRAISDFNQAISLEPDNGNAYHRRGRAFARLQQFDLAHKDYLRALELVQNFAGIYIDLGLLYTKQSEYSKALEAYEMAVENDPGNATAHYNAACVAALLGNVDEACRKLDTAIELHPPYRELAAMDVDFSTIRNTPEFQKRINAT